MALNPSQELIFTAGIKLMSIQLAKVFPGDTETDMGQLASQSVLQALMVWNETHKRLGNIPPEPLVPPFKLDSPNKSTT